MKQRKMNPEQFNVMVEFLRGEISAETAAAQLTRQGYKIAREGVIYTACSLAREWVQKGVVYL